MSCGSSAWISNHTSALIIGSASAAEEAAGSEAIMKLNGTRSWWMFEIPKGSRIDGLKVIASCECQRTFNFHSGICMLNLFQENDRINVQWEKKGLLTAFLPPWSDLIDSHANNTILGPWPWRRCWMLQHGFCLGPKLEFNINFLSTFFFINFINFINCLSVVYQLFINFLSMFYQLFINFLSTFINFLSTLSTLNSLSTELDLVVHSLVEEPPGIADLL